jgi:AraC family transcriptional activator of tynA and feaB
MAAHRAHAAEVLSVEGDAAAFAEGLSRLFVELEVSFPESRQRVVARVATRTFGDLELLRTSVEEGGLIAKRTSKLLAKSSYNSFFVSCVFSGSTRLSQAGRLIELQASDIALLDASLEYSVQIAGPADLLWIRVPRYRLEGRLAAPVEVMAQRVDGRHGLGRLTSTLFQSTYDEVEQVSPPHALRVSNVLLDLLSLSVDTQDQGEKRRSNTVLRRVQNFIEAHLSDPGLSLAMIAERQGVSVRYLNRLFEREGISTARWIRMRRLERCRRDLESEEHRAQPISQIAYANGFNEISSFNRAFRAHFGVSPSSLRQRQG